MYLTQVLDLVHGDWIWQMLLSMCTRTCILPLGMTCTPITQQLSAVRLDSAIDDSSVGIK